MEQKNVSNITLSTIFEEVLQFPIPKFVIFNVVALPHHQFFFHFLDPTTNTIRYYIYEQKSLILDSIKFQSLDQAIIKFPSEKTISPLNPITFTDYTVFIDLKGELIIAGNCIEKSLHAGISLFKSPSYGKKWQNFQSIFIDEKNWLIKGDPLFLEFGESVGRVIIPVLDSAVQRLMCLISSDHFLSWQISLYVEPLDEEDHDFEAIEEQLLINDNSNKMEMNQAKNNSPNVVFPLFSHPYLIEIAPNVIKMITQRKNHIYLYFADSYDNGETWTELKQINSPLISNSNVYSILSVKKRQNTDIQTLLLALIQEENVNPPSKSIRFYASNPNTLKFMLLDYKIDISSFDVQHITLIQDDIPHIHLFYVRDHTQLVHQILSLS
jgi:hypothetical protein